MWCHMMWFAENIEGLKPASLEELEDSSDGEDMEANRLQKATIIPYEQGRSRAAARQAVINDNRTKKLELNTLKSEGSDHDKQLKSAQADARKWKQGHESLLEEKKVRWWFLFLSVCLF